MDIIRVFPSKTNLTPTDVNARFDTPSLFDDRSLPVRVSCTFTWDKPKAEWLAEQWAAYHDDVELGGPAYDDYGGEFTPGMFVKNGAVITSRGCDKICDFCLVPKREGYLRELEVKSGWNVLDNNLLACSEPHLDRVFDMLSQQQNPIEFTGGLDASKFRADHAERIMGLKKSVRIKSLWFACDSDNDVDTLIEAGLRLSRHGLTDQNVRRCYALVDPKRDSMDSAANRMRRIFHAGFLPMAMLLRDGETQKKNYNKEWQKFQRYWALPAIYRQEFK